MYIKVKQLEFLLFFNKSDIRCILFFLFCWGGKVKMSILGIRAIIWRICVYWCEGIWCSVL